VGDAPAECGVRPTSAAQVEPSSGVRSDLSRSKLPFLGHYGELNYVGLQIGLLQRVSTHGTF
jgi:hypothetical protein